MSVEETLQRVEEDIALGDYGKARDRMHGLIATYPSNLALRRKLGDIYWQLQYPAMAGRYWYLEGERSHELDTARRAFEESCGGNAMEMLLCLKFRGELRAIGGTNAERVLLTLQARARDECGCFIDLEKRGAEKYEWVGAKEGWRSKLAGLGCIIAILAGIALMLVGLNTVISWLL